jgi:hypothetical protein
MGPTSHQRSSDESSGPRTPIITFESSEELISIAQEHYSAGFPNPKRIDCPNDDVIKTIVFSGKLPDERLLAHLFKCSECYQRLQTELAAYRATRPAREASLWSRAVHFVTIKPIPVLASSMALLLLILGAVYLIRKPLEKTDRVSTDITLEPKESSPVRGRSSNTPPPPAPSHLPSLPQPIPGQIAGSVGSKNTHRQNANRQPSKPKTPDSKQPPQPGKQLAPSTEETLQTAVNSAARIGASQAVVLRSSPPLLPRHLEDLFLLKRGQVETIKVDLNNYTRVRSVGGEDIKLSRKRIRLLLQLPDGSPKGQYTISILDETRQLQSANARSADGMNLIVDLNLRELAPQKYRLQIKHENSTIPDEYAVILGDAQTKSKSQSN